MPIQKLRQFLDENLVKYIVITHSKAFTSQGVAASAHISGNELAKTVMLKKDGELCMAVLPASKQVNLAVFAKLTSSKDVFSRQGARIQRSFPGLRGRSHAAIRKPLWPPRLCGHVTGPRQGDCLQRRLASRTRSTCLQRFREAGKANNRRFRNPIHTRAA